ncbi:DUF4232 domain-containing protein [Nocardia sp. CA-119907]|uniref:DUF4232 domain-containing protein n=1 Tax=Nocardia sp. CA-119907 TaxID=3239973 RepID=UPI003D978BE4
MSKMKCVPWLAYAAVVAVTGCSSGTTDTGAPGSVAPPTSAPAGSPGTPSAGSPSAPSSGRTADAVPSCADGQVIVGAGEQSAGLGHRSVTLSFSLVQASGPCTLTGYPGVDSGAGGPLVHATRSLRGYLGGLPEGIDAPPTIVLDRDHGAAAMVEGVAVDAAGNNCPSYTSLQVTPPNTTETVPVATTIDVCQPEVHPVTQPR